MQKLTKSNTVMTKGKCRLFVTIYIYPYGITVFDLVIVMCKTFASCLCSQLRWRVYCVLAWYDTATVLARGNQSLVNKWYQERVEILGYKYK